MLQQGPDQDAAWGEFAARYQDTIYRFCLRRQLQPADAQDATQDVLLRLYKGLSRYDRSKGRFRDWLGRVALNAVRDFARAREGAPRGAGGDGARRLLDGVEARQELLQRLGERFDLELLEQARAEVQGGVEGRVWDAYRLLEEEGLSGAEVAGRLGLALGTVYAHRCKVKDKLRAAVRRLENEGAGA
jgi:RNA polymerase sigma-70 factor (ECF subfamily)